MGCSVMGTVHIGKKKLPTGNYFHIEIVNAPVHNYVRFHFHICLISINLKVGVFGFYNVCSDMLAVCQISLNEDAYSQDLTKTNNR